jgi:hypothetical protein
MLSIMFDRMAGNEVALQWGSSATREIEAA